MNDRDKWRERVRDIYASGTTWWWWWGVETYDCGQVKEVWNWNISIGEQYLKTLNVLQTDELWLTIHIFCLYIFVGVGVSHFHCLVIHPDVTTNLLVRLLNPLHWGQPRRRIVLCMTLTYIWWWSSWLKLWFVWTTTKLPLLPGPHWPAEILRQNWIEFWLQLLYDRLPYHV